MSNEVVKDREYSANQSAHSRSGKPTKKRNSEIMAQVPANKLTVEVDFDAGNLFWFAELSRSERTCQMAGPNYFCPKCGFRLRPSELRREGKPYFECPSCKEKLRVSAAYRRFLFIGEVVISIALPFLLGIRDVLRFLIVALVAFFPIVFVFTFLMRSIYPPRFEPYEPADMSLRQITKNQP